MVIDSQQDTYHYRRGRVHFLLGNRVHAAFGARPPWGSAIATSSLRQHLSALVKTVPQLYRLIMQRTRRGQCYVLMRALNRFSKSSADHPRFPLQDPSGRDVKRDRVVYDRACLFEALQRFVLPTYELAPSHPLYSLPVLYPNRGIAGQKSTGHATRTVHARCRHPPCLHLGTLDARM